MIDSSTGHAQFVEILAKFVVLCHLRIGLEIWRFKSILTHLRRDTADEKVKTLIIHLELHVYIFLLLSINLLVSMSKWKKDQTLPWQLLFIFICVQEVTSQSLLKCFCPW